MRNFLDHLGVRVNLKHFVDASAAQGTMMRKGAGKIKHLEVRQLWCQHAVEKLGVTVVRIPRGLNRADNLTRPKGRRELALFHATVGVQTCC